MLLFFFLILDQIQQKNEDLRVANFRMLLGRKEGSLLVMNEGQVF